MLYGNIFNSISGNVFATLRVRISKGNYNLKKFFIKICNVPLQFSTRLLFGVTETSLTRNKTLQKRVLVVFLFSLLHVLKTKFKGSGRFQNVFGETIKSKTRFTWVRHRHAQVTSNSSLEWGHLFYICLYRNT